MTQQQRERYEAALYACFGGVTALDAMLHEYPAAERVEDDRKALELEDLAARIGALTACWEAAGVEEGTGVFWR